MLGIFYVCVVSCFFSFFLLFYIYAFCICFHLEIQKKRKEKRHIFKKSTFSNLVPACQAALNSDPPFHPPRLPRLRRVHQLLDGLGAGERQHAGVRQPRRRHQVQLPPAGARPLGLRNLPGLLLGGVQPQPGLPDRHRLQPGQVLPQRPHVQQGECSVGG